MKKVNAQVLSSLSRSTLNALVPSSAFVNMKPERVSPGATHMFTLLRKSCCSASWRFLSLRVSEAISIGVW